MRVIKYPASPEPLEHSCLCGAVLVVDRDDCKIVRDQRGNKGKVT
jgi:hypothetical protein